MDPGAALERATQVTAHLRIAALQGDQGACVE
jgi:hypothetical protein